MAVSSSSYFTRAIVGVPQVGADVDVFEVNSTPKWALGLKMERNDGAIFRYAHFSTVLSAGSLAATTADQVDQQYIGTNIVVAPSSTYQMPNEQNGVYPGAAGSRYLITYVTASTNQWAGATLTIAASDGVGYTYLVAGATSTGVVATALSRFELYDPIQVSLAAGSMIMLKGNKWNDLKGAAIGTQNVAGVTCANINTAGYYGWVQTHGYCGVLTDALAPVLAGTMAFCTTGQTLGAAGYVATGTASTKAVWLSTPVIGNFAVCGSAAGLSIVWLQIE